LWPALKPYLFNTEKPGATVRMVQKAKHRKKHPNVVTVRWHGQQANDLWTLGSSSVVISELGSATPVYSVTEAPVHGVTTFTGVPGKTYEVTVTTSDIGGGQSAPATAELKVPIDDSAFSFNGKWQRIKRAHALYGSYSQARKAGASAKVGATGSAYALIVVAGPKRGLLDVYLRGHRIQTLDLYNPVKKKETLPIYGDATTSSQHRTFKFKCLHEKSAQSSGRSVSVDGLVVTS
jgi:hypothetical protein